jgi:dihydropteroate synthase
MGILNVTPDSFSDGRAMATPEAAIEAALRMVADGADLVDVGAESTRPGASPVSAQEEWRRLEPVLTGLAGRISVPLSIDTYKADVAERALDCGAVIVNDVSGLTYEPRLAAVVARRQAAIVLMHNRGRSHDMYAQAQYEDVVADVTRELSAAGEQACRAGVDPARIVYDPGLGFAKRAEDTMALLARFGALHALARPLLSGPSRKSFLTRAIGDAPPAARTWATAAAVTASVLAGAHIVRVHDVREMVDVVRVSDALRAAAAEG